MIWGDHSVFSPIFGPPLQRSIERQREVFNALEGRGWALCQDPFQIDMDRTPEKIRKMAMKQAQDLDAELLVEVWDPIYQRQPYRGLTYALWRRMTQGEIVKKQQEQQLSHRPDYSATLGSVEDFEQKLLKPKMEVSRDGLGTLDEMVKETDYELGGEVYGSSDEDMGMVAEKLETRSVLNPYHHQGIKKEEETAKKDETPQTTSPQSPPVWGWGDCCDTSHPRSSDHCPSSPSLCRGGCEGGVCDRASRGRDQGHERGVGQG